MNWFAKIVCVAIFCGCSGSFYTLTINDDNFRMRPGMNIEKVKKTLSKYQYQYSENGQSQTLQYYGAKQKTGKIKHYILKFEGGQLHTIEAKEVDSIF